MSKRALKKESERDEITFQYSVREPFEKQKKVICDLFIEAVNDYDGNKILEIAKAVWFFEKTIKQIRGGADFERTDRVRAMLWFLKEALNMTGEKMSARKATEFITDNNNPPKEKIDAIRNICIAMNFPLLKKRKIRKK